MTPRESDMRKRAASPVAPTDVLYVDSDGDFASLVERSLTRLDPTVSVEHVESAEAAFESVSDGVDCVVSAYTLRKTDAVSFLKQFRRRYPDLPFVLFTGAGSETVAADAIAAGVSAYVPVRAGENNFELLAQRIWTVTQGYRAKKRAESATEELRKAYQRTDEAVVAVGPEWRIIFSNDQFATRYGVERERIGGLSLWDTVPELDREAIRSACESVIQTGEPEVVSATLSDSSRLSARIFPDEDGGVIFYLSDATDRWRRDSHTGMLRAVADGVSTPAIVMDRELTVVFANTPAKNALGVSETGESGIFAGALSDALADTDRKRIVAAVESTLAQARGNGRADQPETVERASEGSILPSENTGVRDSKHAIDGIDVRGLDRQISVEVEPFALESEPHVLVTADTDEGEFRTSTDDSGQNGDYTTADDNTSRTVDKLE